MKNNDSNKTSLIDLNKFIDQNQNDKEQENDSSSNGFSNKDSDNKNDFSENNSMDEDSDQNYPQIHEDEKHIEQLEIQKQQENQSLKEYAIQNGFVQNIENPQAKNIENLQKKSIEENQFIDRKKLLKELFVPPPLEIFYKKNFIKEPVRTGFNQGMILLNLKNNFEAKKSAQGPYIINSKITNFRRRDTNQLDKVKPQNKSMTRENSINKLELLQKNELRQTQTGKQYQSATKDQQLLSDRGNLLLNDDDFQQQKINIIQSTHQNETSLRHLFYLEYKRNFPEGQTNPIVYSRFGKTNYDSDQKFDINNFNQLIRTCNLKKIIREVDQENINKPNQKEKIQFREAILYPQTDYYTPKDINDKTLVFESRFESGNLQLAHKLADNEYNLIIQNDINSKGHTQWFYFRVSNAKKGMKVKFNMLNMIKNKSLYNDGMKVLIYSAKKQEIAQEQSENNQEDQIEKESLGWARGGEDLGYFQNHYKKDYQNNMQRCYFTFTFTHTFEYDNDSVYFAYSQPYTYTDLTDYLCEIQAKQLNFVTRNTLCRTIAGNKCEYLTITNRVPFEVDKKKEGVVLTARIHPGESISSLMMKGVIDFLISNDPKAQELRDKFVFKIIPMLNPDGVINGNYRCSLAGCDLNRRWKYPSQILHPTVFHTKKLILKLASERHLALYCDFHAHSRRKNVFIYGNSFDEFPQQPRVFPFLLSKLAQPNFSYDYSRFNYCRSKEQTARIAIWRELGSKIPNIFTIEASFCGPKAVKYEPHRQIKKISLSELNYHFSTQDFLDIGRNLCEATLLYRQEKEATVMGIENVEYQVEQYHIEKEARIEQEKLIQQQQYQIEQRKLQEIQNKNFKSHAPQQQINTITNQEQKNELTQKKENQQKKENENPQAVNEKVVKQKKSKKLNKKRSISEDTTQNKNTFSEDQKPKKKINYNIRDNSDESDAQSDSEPSEDNLDADQILKLIPKKFGKKKFIFGVDDYEKQKKIYKKQKEKKPKTELMPCLQNKRKELEEMKRKEAELAEKILQKKQRQNLSVSKTSIFKRNGTFMRDFATQIQYRGDGLNLSLMEQEILKLTGSFWSRIIYPGFKGYINPQEKYDIIKATTEKVERNFKFGSIIPNNFVQTQTQVSPVIIKENILDENSTQDNKNEYTKKQVLIGKQMEFNSQFIENLYKKQYDNYFLKNKEASMCKQLASIDKQNESTEKTQNQSQNDQRNQNIPQIQDLNNLIFQQQRDLETKMTLHQKIQETKFFEARSLMGALGSNLQLSSKKKQVLRQNLFEYGNEKNHENQKPMVSELKNNENLKVYKQSSEIQYQDLEKSDKKDEKLYKNQSNSSNKQNKYGNYEDNKTIKVIVNGVIVTQKMLGNVTQSIKSPQCNDFNSKLIQVGDLLNSGYQAPQGIELKNQQKSSQLNFNQKQFQDTKSNFSQIAQQILINNQECQKQMNMTSINDEQRIFQQQFTNLINKQKIQTQQEGGSNPIQSIMHSSGKAEQLLLQKIGQVQPLVYPQIVNSTGKVRLISTDKQKDEFQLENLSMKQKQLARIQNIQRQSKVQSYL